jgi:hypothetical protein
VIGHPGLVESGCFIARYFRSPPGNAATARAALEETDITITAVNAELGVAKAVAAMEQVG